MTTAVRPSTGDLLARITALVWLGFALGVLAIGAFGSDALRARVAEDGPGCPLRMTTGLRCAFCGMTHATLALGHGDLREAFRYHPLAPVVLAGVLYVYVKVAVGGGEALLRGRRPYAILGIIGLVWIVNLIA